MLRARRRLARWLDPEPPVAPQPAPEPPPSPPVSAEPSFWPQVGQQLALRVLATTYRLSSHIAEAEAAEHNPDQLERLYRADHAVHQLRRQAEILHVLTGLRVDDAGRQVTTLLDVVRAAASAIEQYQRVRVGQVAHLAVAEHAADDVIRVLTELVDNAARYSPPNAPVTVSAHLTERDTVLLRVEDSGVGVAPFLLPYLNEMLAGDVPPAIGADLTPRLGLVVVRRLAEANGIRVHLTPRQAGGTTAVAFLPEDVLCEVPTLAPAVRPAPPPARPLAPRRRGAAPSAALAPVPAPAPAPAPASVASAQDTMLLPVGNLELAGLPLRNPESVRNPESLRNPESVRNPEGVRGAAAAEAPAAADPSADTRWVDDVGDFAAGVADATRDHSPAPVRGLP